MLSPSTCCSSGLWLLLDYLEELLLPAQLCRCRYLLAWGVPHQQPSKSGGLADEHEGIPPITLLLVSWRPCPCHSPPCGHAMLIPSISASIHIFRIKSGSTTPSCCASHVIVRRHWQGRFTSSVLVQTLPLPYLLFRGQSSEWALLCLFPVLWDGPGSLCFSLSGSTGLMDGTHQNCLMSAQWILIKVWTWLRLQWLRSLKALVRDYRRLWENMVSSS